MTKPDYRKQVQEIAEVAEEFCNQWEYDFIQSMLEWDGEFTEKQKTVIDKIYLRACESSY